MRNLVFISVLLVLVLSSSARGVPPREDMFLKTTKTLKVRVASAEPTAIEMVGFRPKVLGVVAPYAIQCGAGNAEMTDEELNADLITATCERPDPSRPNHFRGRVTGLKPGTTYRLRMVVVHPQKGMLASEVVIATTPQYPEGPGPRRTHPDERPPPQ